MNEWSYAELFRILDKASQNSDSACKIDQDLSHLMRSAVPPFLVHGFDYDAHYGGSQPQYDFDRLLGPIRKETLETTKLWGIVCRGLSKLSDIPDQLEASPHIENSGLKNSRLHHVARLRWHIDAWSSGILPYPKIKDWSGYGWDLPDLEPIKKSCGGSLQFGSKALIQSLIHELGPRGKGTESTSRFIKDVKLNFESEQFDYPSKNPEKYNKSEFGSFVLGLSDLGTRKRFLGEKHYSSGTRLVVTVSANPNYVPLIQHTDIDQDEKVRKLQDAKINNLLGKWLNHKEKQGAIPSKSNLSRDRVGKDKISKKTQDDYFRVSRLFVKRWNWFINDLKEFWAPLIFPAWLKVDFRFTVPWPGFSTLGSNQTANLGENFTLGTFGYTYLLNNNLQSTTNEQ